MKTKELKDKSVAELKRLLAEKREAVREMNFKVSQRQLKNVREIRDAKQEVARILTILGQKEKEEVVTKIKSELDK